MKSPGLIDATMRRHDLFRGEYIFEVDLSTPRKRNPFFIMRQTGHRSLVTLRRYIREGQLFRAAAAGKLGL